MTRTSLKWLPKAAPNQSIAAAQHLFQATYNYQPQGVWAAPGRANLIGEHVDYAGGICLPFALAERAYLAASPNDAGIYRVVSPGGEPQLVEIPTSKVGLRNPDNWASYVVGAVWTALGPGQGFDLALYSEVPIGGGLSSSAALGCSAALAAQEIISGHSLTETERIPLIASTKRAENEVAGAPTGGIDQHISLLGQVEHALAIDFAQGSYEQIPCALQAAGLVILVIDTGIPHSLRDGQYSSRRQVIDAVTAYAGQPYLRTVSEPLAVAEEWAEQNVPTEYGSAEWKNIVRRRVHHVFSEISHTQEAISYLQQEDWRRLGEAMQKSHISLRHDFEVSIPELDTAVEIALANGAYGARLTGGGFGGAAIALLERERVEMCAEKIAEAFAWRGYSAPAFLLAYPSQGAERVA